MQPLALTVISLFAFAVCAPAQTTVKFDDMKPGALAAPWHTGVTGKGIAKWEVVADDSAPSKPNALKQSGEATFVWAAKTDVKVRDGFGEVKLKTLSGSEDQAGGLVWRWRHIKRSRLPSSPPLQEGVNDKNDRSQ